ncbi:hypothetical protein VM1G_00892 [Cytospora mali]|uniref:Uncharacterized protein n=2 Tax=Cytospora mali TaxID=578113 RepID=A0ACD6AYC7_CYTMA|nr:hypothetical protein VP1G_06463 [Valsa mali var. pyri (nom. inval.)]KUI64484.1 hypothetical protein VM1G_00892 [Valsa mali]
MAKSSRASSKKANNQRLKKGVFGPIESARQERLSAKLLELAAQPKPVPEQKMDDVSEKAETEQTKTVAEEKTEDTMDIDENGKPQRKLKGRIVKRRGRKSGIVFPKFGDRNKVKKRK